MATIEELEARQRNLHVAEAAALDALAAGMRELAVELPDGSNLALKLAKGSQDLTRVVNAIARHDFEDDWPVNWGGDVISVFVLARMRETCDRIEGEVA